MTSSTTSSPEFTLLSNYAATINTSQPADIPVNIYTAGISLLDPAVVTMTGFEYDVSDYMDGYIKQYLNFVPVESIDYLDSQYNRLLEAQNTLFNGICQYEDPDGLLTPFFELIMRNKMDMYARYRRYKLNVRANGLHGPDMLSIEEAIYRMSQI